MYNLKKATKALALALALTMAVPAGMPMSTATVAEAATVKLSATKKTLTKGKSFTLTVKGTKKKVTWKTSKKAVATVNSKGKVTAKKAGTATITAKVGTKSYKCKVTVKNPVNKYVAKAPFAAKEVKIDNYTMAVPKDWQENKMEVNGVTAYVLMPKDANPLTGSANISVVVVKTEGATQENFEMLKAYLSETMTKENFEIALKETLGTDLTLNDFQFGEEKINLGKAIKVTYGADYEVEGVKGTLKQVKYDVFANGYTIEVVITDNGAGVTPDVYEVGNYLLNSLIYTK